MSFVFVFSLFKKILKNCLKHGNISRLKEQYALNFVSNGIFFDPGDKCMAGIQMVKYSEGDVILKEEEINEHLFKIISGHAEVYVGYGTDHETLIKILGEQSCFGELGMLLHKPSIYTIKAYSDMLVMKIPEESFEEFIKTNHQIVLNMLRNTTETMLTFKLHIDLLLKEIESGQKPSETTIKNVKNLVKAYGIYKSIDEAMLNLKRNV